jgi:hypothetical protein
MCPFKEELMRENTLNILYPNGFVIDFAGNIVPLLPPKILIDYSSNLEIETDEINLLDDYIYIDQ